LFTGKSKKFNGLFQVLHILKIKLDSLTFWLVGSNEVGLTACRTYYFKSNHPPSLTSFVSRVFQFFFLAQKRRQIEMQGKTNLVVKVSSLAINFYEEDQFIFSAWLDLEWLFKVAKSNLTCFSHSTHNIGHIMVYVQYIRVNRF
jgi:hypothetical protein